MNQNEENAKSLPNDKPAEAEPPHKKPDFFPDNIPHKCKVCGSPDHRACGCEAKKKRIDQDNDPGLVQLEKELEREEVLEKIFKQAETYIPSEIYDLFSNIREEQKEDWQAIHDRLSDIITALNMIVHQLKVIIEHQKSRAAELRDVLDVD